ncbi:MAG: hypothetical protein EBS29_09015 [Chloroflexia bacterium]|nr:hypothetical protein [Chloroflexia bacterium]
MGNGSATLAVSGAGVAAVSGFLPDGRAWTTRARLTTEADVLVYVPLYGGQGIVQGVLKIRSSSESDVAGILSWTRPAIPQPKGVYPSFTADVTVRGDRYQYPIAGKALVPVTPGQNNAALALTGGGLSQTLVQTATLSTANVLTVTRPTLRGLTARVNAATGTFSGTFVHPVSGLPTTFRGVVLQSQGAGFGVFSNPDGSGYATLAPAESMARLLAQ